MKYIIGVAFILLGCSNSNHSSIEKRIEVLDNLYDMQMKQGTYSGTAIWGSESTHTSRTDTVYADYGYDTIFGVKSIHERMVNNQSDSIRVVQAYFLNGALYKIYLTPYDPWSSFLTGAELGSATYYFSGDTMIHKAEHLVAIKSLDLVKQHFDSLAKSLNESLKN